MAATDPATHRQLAYIKELAYSRGVSFIPPANRVEASQLIDQLKRQRALASLRDRRRPRADDRAARRARTRQLTPRRRDHRLRLARPLAQQQAAAPPLTPWPPRSRSQLDADGRTQPAHTALPRLRRTAQSTPRHPLAPLSPLRHERPPTSAYLARDRNT